MIFFGPRRIPEMARKFGKLMADFRNTTNEFKATWEREVNFEEEEKALRTGELPTPVARTSEISDSAGAVSAPEIRAMDAEEVRAMLPVSEETPQLTEPPIHIEENNEKRDWL